VVLPPGETNCEESISKKILFEEDDLFAVGQMLACLDASGCCDGDGDDHEPAAGVGAPEGVLTDVPEDEVRSAQSSS
jgi:hypothetical protein